MMQFNPGRDNSRNWWTGKSLPILDGPPRSIWADGDEALLIWALLVAYKREYAIATEWNTQGESHAG